MLPFQNMTAFNLQEATIPHKAGDAVIYPANLTHGYESNPTGDRITLTFNVVPYSITNSPHSFPHIVEKVVENYVILNVLINIVKCSLNR
jgi:ectoine hydroxylase-related dioxygenase (phytanoyl-CoA dioxygenase family)